jgi:hypothetical protein
MEAQGPITRRRNSLPLDGRTGFERSDPARNFSSKPLTALMASSTTVAAGNLNATPPATPTVARIGANPRVVELLLSGRGSLLKDLVSLIGIDGAARLIGAFAGMRLYVPHTPAPDDSLSELIGHDAARALAQVYGGDRIDIPNPTPRRIQIIDLRASGVSIDGIARSLHCTRRRVFQVLAEARRKQALRDLPQPR